MAARCSRSRRPGATSRLTSRLDFHFPLKTRALRASPAAGVRRALMAVLLLDFSSCFVLICGLGESGRQRHSMRNITHHVAVGFRRDEGSQLIALDRVEARTSSAAKRKG